MCKFEENVKKMSFENCNLFKRSFTTYGMGFTFNNEREEILIKKDYRIPEFSHNVNGMPSLMKSTNSKDSLTVIIDSNAEEVAAYEKHSSEPGIVHNKPKAVFVSLHNPLEPADARYITSTSMKIPLGYTTTFYITPQATEIDENGKANLMESERKCRLNEDTDNMDVFNVYTRVACLFECKMKYAMERCGCIPWNYPININKNVKNNIFPSSSKIHCLYVTCVTLVLLLKLFLLYIYRVLCFVIIMATNVLMTIWIMLLMSTTVIAPQSATLSATLSLISLVLHLMPKSFVPAPKEIHFLMIF